ncbi:MAG: polyketide synthase, partial [Exilibacterium sp.]
MNTDDIAVVGMAGRFPDAKNVEEFWANLVGGKNSIKEVPQDRWCWREFWGDPLNEEGKTNSKWGSFLTDVDKFDAQFFGISPKEAELMDPQQRIMMEVCWSCFEDAGITPSALPKRNVGVYLGVFNNDYKELIDPHPECIAAHHATGSATSILSNRISYFFDFVGPSLSIDTACSSSLICIHLAMQAMRAGECELALAGGINLLFTPNRHISFAKTGMLSATGQCYSFDERANGYVRGEGAGVLLLKPLESSLADRNRIYGVIKASAINHGGKAHTLTYPSAESQSEV